MLRIYEICTNGAVPEELRQMTSATNRYHYADESEDNAWVELLYFVGIPSLIFAVIIALLLMPKKCPKWANSEPSLLTDVPAAASLKVIGLFTAVFRPSIAAPTLSTGVVVPVVGSVTL